MFFSALLSDPDLNYKRAAKKIGMRPSRAKQLVDRKDVQVAINHLLDERSRRLQIDNDSLLYKIVDLLEMATGDKPVKRASYDAKLGMFIEQEVHHTDLAAAARFTDQLGRHLGTFGQDQQNGMQVVMQMNFGTPSPPDKIEEKPVAAPPALEHEG